MSTLPEIRWRLHELAEEHGLPELAALAEETRRRFNGRRGPVKHAPLTEDQVQAIRTYALGHPQDHLWEVALAFDTNQGRVSEALWGKRT